MVSFESTDPVEQFLIEVHSLRDRDGRLAAYCLGDDTEDEIRIAKILVAKIAAMEREACRQIALRKMRMLKDTERAHYKQTSSAFIPSRFGFDMAAVNEGMLIADAIAARGQA